MSRYIDADALPRHGQRGGLVHWKDIEDAPSIDIVRCKDCKYFIDNLTEDDTDEMYDACRWDWKRRIPNPDDFCSYGEREGE